MQRISWQFRGMEPDFINLKSIGRGVLTMLASVFLVVGTVTGAFAGSASVEGIWYDDTGKGAVEIRRCGGSLCGHIVWLRNPKDKAGQPLTDQLNPTADRRTRPICGLQVIGRLEPMQDGSWDRGWIYDPKQGKAFDVMVSLRSPDELVVTGYLGLKFLSESFVWRRAPEDLGRCVAGREGNQARR
jgi:uncharacterized protein (DUF2147 family)